MITTKSAEDQWHKEGGQSPLAAFVNFVHPISEEATRFINENSFYQQAERGNYLLKEGDMCKHLYFVRKGVIRGYVKDGTKEVTTWITAENEMVSSIRAFS